MSRIPLLGNGPFLFMSPLSFTRYADPNRIRVYDVCTHPEWPLNPASSGASYHTGVELYGCSAAWMAASTWADVIPPPPPLSRVVTREAIAACSASVPYAASDAAVVEYACNAVAIAASPCADDLKSPDA